jgi:hypothetical protein
MPQAKRNFLSKIYHWRILVRLCCVAESYGAKIQSGIYIKICLNIFTLHFLGAFSKVQGAFPCFTIVFVDFTLKNFSGLLSSLVLMKIESAKLVLIVTCVWNNLHVFMNFFTYNA